MAYVIYGPYITYRWVKFVCHVAIRSQVYRKVYVGRWLIMV